MILELYRLIDWLMWLPEDLTLAFRQQVLEYEAEVRMPYVTTTERQARAEGRQEGRQEGWQEAAQDNILDLLELRFGQVPYRLREQVKSPRDSTALRALLREAALTPSLDAFRAHLTQAGA